jgi:hypothetical protein
VGGHQDAGRGADDPVAVQPGALGLGLRRADGGFPEPGQFMIGQHPGEEFIGGERFGDVVIGAGGQPLCGGVRAVPGGQHDHR